MLKNQTEKNRKIPCCIKESFEGTFSIIWKLILHKTDCLTRQTITIVMFIIRWWKVTSMGTYIHYIQTQTDRRNINSLTALEVVQTTMQWRLILELRYATKKLYTFFSVVDVKQFEVNGGTFETWEILKEQKLLVGGGGEGGEGDHLLIDEIFWPWRNTILNWQFILSKYAFINNKMFNSSFLICISEK